MSLKRKVKDITTVDEKYRDLYTQKKDGDDWILTEIESHDAVDILASVRKEAGTLRVKNKDWETKFAAFEGLDLDAVQTALTENEALKAEKEALGTKDSKLIDNAVAAKLKVTTGPLEAKLKKAETDLEKFKLENTQLKNAQTQRTVDDAVLGAFSELKVEDDVWRVKGNDSDDTPDGLLWARNRFAIGEDGKVTDKKNGLSPKDLLVQMRDEGQRPHWFGSTGGTGSQTPGSGNKPGKNPWMPGAAWNQYEQCKIQEADPKRAAALAAAAGLDDIDAPFHPKDGAPKEYSQY